MNFSKLTLPAVACVALASGGALLMGAGPSWGESQSGAVKTEAPAADAKKPEAGDKKAEAAAPAPVETPKTDWTPDDITEMVLGNPDAPVTVTEYASFTCPHCASFHQNQFKELKRDYIDTGKVKLVYRDVYFDRIGLWAAMVARCDTDKFFGIADLIYSKKDEWLNSRDPVVLAANLRKLGVVAGLAPEKVDACMQDASKAKALYDWFEINANKDQIESTPSLLINGKLHSNMAYGELKDLIEAELGS
ncbi:DsbA family protein [Rhodobacteraceae bacterium D3-12]|nr:DsbA family protein [Rhodobacteraceae bacterium D3-12]